MTPPDMTHAEGFLNFRNKWKRLQQNSSRSLCGLASSQYERVHSAHTHKKKCTLERRRQKERGSLFCYSWGCSPLHKFALYFPSSLIFPQDAQPSVNAVRISSGLGALNSRDRMVLTWVLWAWDTRGLSLLLKKVNVLPLAPFSFLTAELRDKQAETQPWLCKKIRLISYQHTCVGSRACY